LILSYVRSGDLALIVSPAHDIEISAMDNAIERERLLSTLDEIGHRAAFGMHRVRRRAEEWREEGLGPADAAHLAFAEAVQASFVTCDERLLRQCRRIRTTIWYGTPIAFCAEEYL
jgi:predicted nucleic acid-binding protein